MSVEWPSSAVIAQTNKATYYSHFLSVSESCSRQYKCGDTMIVKIDKKTLLAELTHIWQASNSKNSGHVRLRIYCRPDDLPHGRTHHHGEHEILLFHKPAILTCEQLVSIVQSDIGWLLGVPLQPPITPPTNSSPSAPSQSGSDILYCNEIMVPVGGFHDETGVSPASSPVLTRLNDSHTFYRILVISYSAYCRYRAVLKRFSPNPYECMSHPLVQAMGGLPLPPVPTLALFCRKTYRDMSLERRLGILEGRIVPLESKPSSQNEVNQSTINSGGGDPPKRKRGRPRKTMPKVEVPEGPPPVKRKRGRPRKHPLPDSNDNNSTLQVKKTETVVSNDLDHRSTSPAPPTLNLHVTPPLTQQNGASSCNGELMSDTTNSSDENTTSGNQTSPFTRHNEGAVPRSLRPRDTLLPPPQFRDDSIYDTKLHLAELQPQAGKHAPSTNEDTKKNLVAEQQQQSEQINEVDSCNKVEQSPVIPSPSPSHANATITAVSTATPAPPPPPAICPDVRQLLRAHLLRLQQDNGKQDHTQTMLQNLDEHLLEEKPFLDLLFCFMKLRNTPIHKIPRLGSKYLNLYSLFQSTTRMGGYDQVTINRKWSSVFDSMGCSTGMTCASTVTRKHYEKLLLPFEKALTAMKQAAQTLQQNRS